MGDLMNTYTCMKGFRFQRTRNVVKVVKIHTLVYE